MSGEEIPVTPCYACATCGVGEECYCASPLTVGDRVPRCASTEPTGLVGDFWCSLAEDHDGDHEAWALPGAEYKGEPRMVATWSVECGAPVVTLRGKLFTCDKPPGHGGLHSCSTFSP